MNIKLLSGGSGGRGRGYCSSAGGGPVTTEKKLIYASNDSNNPGDNITVLGSVSDWPLNVPGTLSADNLNASLYRAGFGFNAKYGVIIYVNVPLRGPAGCPRIFAGIFTGVQFMMTPPLVRGVCFTKK
jgi:hypothetical protein